MSFDFSSNNFAATAASFIKSGEMDRAAQSLITEADAPKTFFTDEGYTAEYFVYPDGVECYFADAMGVELINARRAFFTAAQSARRERCAYVIDLNTAYGALQENTPTGYATDLRSVYVTTLADSYHRSPSALSNYARYVAEMLDEMEDDADGRALIEEHLAAVEDALEMAHNIDARVVPDLFGPFIIVEDAAELAHLLDGAARRRGECERLREMFHYCAFSVYNPFEDEHEGEYTSEEAEERAQELAALMAEELAKKKQEAPANTSGNVTRVTVLTEARCTGQRNWARRVVLVEVAGGLTIAKDYTGGDFVRVPEYVGAKVEHFRVTGGELSRALKYKADAVSHDEHPEGLGIWAVSLDGGNTIYVLASTYEDARKLLVNAAGCRRTKRETHKNQDGATIYGADGRALGSLHYVDARGLYYDQKSGSFRGTV